MVSAALLSSLAAVALLPWTSVASTPKAVGLDFSRVKHRREAPRIARRGKDVSVTIDNARMMYFADITVGTPPQPIRVQIDTGSADLWVPHAKPGKSGGYNANVSSTKRVESGSTFAINYGTGDSPVDGTYVHDVVRIGDASFGDLRFGWANDYNPMQDIYLTSLLDTAGLMGVGPKQLEAQVQLEHKQPYANVVAKLKADKFIHTQAFSLCLGAPDASSGTIIFGGVDPSRYSGPLISLPQIENPIEKGYAAYAVQLSGIDAQSHGEIKTFKRSNDSAPMYTVLDSGAPGIYLPQSIVQPMYEYLGASYIKEFGSAVVPCNISTASTIFSFYFGGPQGVKIEVPIANLIAPAIPLTDGAQFADNTTACVLHIKPSIDFKFILGHPFLNSAYVVYDIENKQIAMAQANTSSKAEPNIQEIKAGMWGIPGVDTVMPKLPWDRKAIKDEAPKPKDVVHPLQGTAALKLNLTLPFNPVRGAVTAAGPAGALFTNKGFVVPSDGMKTASPTSVGSGNGKGGAATATPSGSGKQPPKPTATPTSGAVKIEGMGGIMGAMAMGLSWVLFF